MATPSLRLMELKARILPLKMVLVPRVADELTCQKILHACAPLMSTTKEDEAVVRVDPI